MSDPGVNRDAVPAG